MTTTAKAGAGKCVRMRVTEAERRLLMARRGAEPPFRLPVISGYREPRTIPELMEVLRSFLETNFGFLIDNSRGQPGCVSIQGGLYEDELPHVSIYFTEEDFPDGSLPTLDADELAYLKSYRDDRHAARLAKIRPTPPPG